MTAHATAATSRLAPPVRPRVPRPLRRALVVLAVLLTLTSLVALHGDTLAHAAHAACTAGEPDDITCTESLVRFGFPS